MNIGETQRRKKSRLIGDPQKLTREEFDALERVERIRLIKRLIPIGLMAVSRELESEIESILGRSGDPDGPFPGARRYGSNPGSVVLGNQKVPVRVPRIRSDRGEIPLETYRLLHEEEVSESLYNSILGGVSCRDFEKTLESEPGSISKTKSTISRKFTEKSSEQLKLFSERDLSHLDVVALFIDGTPFAKDQMIIVLGVTIDGRKVVLGFSQASSETGLAVKQLLVSLIDRGLRVENGLLVVTDGSKGLISGIKQAFPKQCLIQRCQWHKRENVVGHLAKSEHEFHRKRLTKAWSRPTLQEARTQLQDIYRELEQSNQSAARSLEEGLEETLTLHRLGLFAKMGRSFKTTNCIESLNAGAEKHCGKVKYWKNSNQKHRWLACALLEIEPTLNKVAGSTHLPELRKKLKKELKIDQEKDSSN